MDVRGSATVVLLLAIVCTTCTAWPRVKRSETACERLQRDGMALYNSSQFYIAGMPLPSDVVAEFGPRRIEQILCSLGDASTLDDLTDAIDPNFDAEVRDRIQLYYLVGTSILEFLGGVDGVRERVYFLKAWADFARDNLRTSRPSYDVAYEFTSNLVNTYGEDYLKTFARGTSMFSGLVGDDVLNAENLAHALAEESMVPELFDYALPWGFAETSGLSRNTCYQLDVFVRGVTSRRGDDVYPLMVPMGEDLLTFLQTLGDLGLLDLQLGQ